MGKWTEMSSPEKQVECIINYASLLLSKSFSYFLCQSRLDIYGENMSLVYPIPRKESWKRTLLSTLAKSLLLVIFVKNLSYNQLILRHTASPIQRSKISNVRNAQSNFLNQLTWRLIPKLMQRKEKKITIALLKKRLMGGMWNVENHSRLLELWKLTCWLIVEKKMLNA